MNTEYNSPADNRSDDGREWTKEEEICANDKAKTLEKDGHDKSKNFKVLNNDGSLGDLPDNQTPGAGALEGTVGLGT